MKLHEKLQALVDAGKLSTDDVKQISTLVDTVKASANTKTSETLNTKLQEIEAKNSELNKQLAPYLKKEKAAKLNGLLKDLVTESNLKDLIKLSEITDEDTDEVIVTKAKEAIESRDWLKLPVAEVITPKEVVKTVGEMPKIETEDSESKVDLNPNANWKHK